MRQLSKHFTFEELTNTGHIHLLESNRREAEQYAENLKELACTVLDPIREKFGPLLVSSGFRGPSLNSAVGGVKTSQHCVGQAADVYRPEWGWTELDKIVNWIAKESGLTFGQVIREEHGDSHWIHVSTGDKKQALDYKDGQYTPRT